MLFTTTTYNTEGLILMFMIAENNQIITQILDLLVTTHQNSYLTQGTGFSLKSVLY